MREYSGRFLDFLRGLPIEIAPLPEELAVLSLARRHQLSFYDAAYLELAQRERIALATLDRALARAAVAEGVELIGAV
jgi:predicted nucleic acid-binding protein